MPLQRLPTTARDQVPSSLDPSLRPVTTAGEVDALLKVLPVVVDRKRFLEFVLGFPRRYLEGTPAIEVVRQFVLRTHLGERHVISALARDGDGWHLSVIARDRTFLFSRIAGSLSTFGLNILRAEAFANANALVLDTFEFEDPEGRFESAPNRREFQVFLERVLAGEETLEDRLPASVLASPAVPLTLEWDNDSHAEATLLSIWGPDQLGLLYRLSHAISVAGCNITMAFLSTRGGEIRDRFYLTFGERKLSEAEQRSLTRSLRGTLCGKSESG